MKVLVVDVGGTHIKVASSDHPVPIKIGSGPTLTAKQMVADVLAATEGWEYDAITIGFPGPVVHDRPAKEPHNLGPGWVGFDYQSHLPRPVRFLNDAAMQALGGYQGGKMLFLGVGTGLGSALIVDGLIVPLELAHLPYHKGKTYEEYIGLAGLERRGKRRWRKSVLDIVSRLRAAFVADYVLLGGGQAKLLKTYPEGVLLGANSNAIAGGIALWAGLTGGTPSQAAPALEPARPGVNLPAIAPGAQEGKPKPTPGRRKMRLDTRTASKATKRSQKKKK